MRYKRWGYTIRKWIQTPLGLLEQVRIPRVRSAHNEIRLFIDRFCRRSSENRQYRNIRRFMRDFWQVFDTLSKKEMEIRANQFIKFWQEKEEDAIKVFLRNKQKLII